MQGETEATVIVVTYNSALHIGATLDALLEDPSRPVEIIVVDNASTDATAQVVSERPVQWHPLDTNSGFGVAVNAGVAIASQATVAVINDDITVTPGWLPPLVHALATPGVGAAMATIELADKPGHFNTSGGAVSVSGLAWITDLGVEVPTDEPGVVDVPFPSGAAFAVRRDTWNRLGGFREDLFMYHEDTDLGWRLRMLGMRTVRVPGSVVRHHYEFGRHPAKMRLLERNRLRIVATNYRRSTLALLAPVLLMHEVGVVVVAIRDGWFGGKVRSWAARPFSRSARQRYRSVQATRQIGDAEILAERIHGVASIAVAGMDVPRGARIVDSVTKGYVRIVLPLVRALDRRATK